MDVSHKEIRNNDARYPKTLASLVGAPSVLYGRGNIELLMRPSVAVVGTRNATDYGKEVTRAITADLARAGLVIVSGLALGIDAVAHQSTLDVGGATIAVLGSGVGDDTIGPRQNLSLARNILQHDGLIVSEYPLGMQAAPWTFPARNRIVSGLSQCVVVTEAAIKSGALITARLAAEQGRDVYAVPGSILWPRSEGPNHLIQNGAHVATSANNILEQFDLKPEDRNLPVSTQNPVQRSIVAILDDGPSHLDSIITATQLPASEIMAALSHMELDGSVVSMQNGFWRNV